MADSTQEVEQAHQTLEQGQPQRAMVPVLQIETADQKVPQAPAIQINHLESVQVLQKVHPIPGRRMWMVQECCQINHHQSLLTELEYFQKDQRALVLQKVLVQECCQIIQSELVRQIDRLVWVQGIQTPGLGLQRQY